MNGDRGLVDAVLAREPGAFERLLREHRGLVWHIVYRMVRHPEDAHDLCQETFMRVHQKLRQFRYESTLKTWIGRVAYSIAIRHLHRQRTALGTETLDEEFAVDEDAPANTFDLDAAVGAEQATGRLTAAIESLPPLPRMLLTLYHLDDVSIPEIAEMTGLPPGTIKSHLFRARLRLRALLEPGRGPRMNPATPPSTDSPVEREWLLQERALGEERQRSGTAGAGARLLRYRLVCRQLLRPVGEQDLSMSPAATARQIQAVVAAKARAATRLERLLVAAFLMVVGACAAGAVAYTGGIGGRHSEPSPPPRRIAGWWRSPAAQCCPC